MKFREYSFEKLQAWEKSKELAKVIYELTKVFPTEERYGFISQMRRSAVSVPANLAEGSARITKKDKAHFTTQAFSSLMEVLNHLIITYELGFVEKEKYTTIRAEIDGVAALISGLRSSLLK